MSIFEEKINEKAPLADKIRPTSLDDFVGQEHIIGKSSVLYKLIKNNNVSNLIISGPPGTGKTTLAKIISNSDKCSSEILNAGLSGINELKLILSKAKIKLEMDGTKTYLIIDEIHKWNKLQQASILDVIERGIIILIGLTTENPYSTLSNAIISRSNIFFFNDISEQNIKNVIIKTLKDKEKGLGKLNIVINDDTISYLARVACGDVRAALNTLEVASKICEFNEQKELEITKKNISDSVAKNSLTLSDNLYYDLISAFCKSIRGGSADAALYYANRLISSGVDARIIARRLIVHASEDVGMADSNALLISNIALNTIEKIGMPEANIPLSHAIIYVSTAPKSNSVYKAMKSSIKDALDPYKHDVPHHLRQNQKTVKKYKNPHDNKGAIEQKYFPSTIGEKKYYVPNNVGKDKG